MKTLLRRLGVCVLAVCLFSLGISAHAETFTGSGNWQVVFSDRMESNFKTSDMSDTLSQLQPGDTAVFKINLLNQNKKSVDWYMLNKVLYSLEDRSANTGTSGGAYSYLLTYTNSKGEVNTLFDSDTLGGEENGSGVGEGLHAATDALKDYFYLDSLESGQSGTIQLNVSLDGETQGNAYQDTLADLEMKFAAEMTTPTKNGTRTEIVKTGDEMDLQPLYTAMAVSGVLLLFLACYSLTKSRKKHGKKQK